MQSWIEAGLPISIIAFKAERTVLPVNKTSSTRIISFSFISNVMFDTETSGCFNRVLKSSRYNVTSRTPNGKSALSICFIFSTIRSVSYTHLRAHETVLDLVCRLLLEKKKKNIRHRFFLIYIFFNSTQIYQTILL